MSFTGYSGPRDHWHMGQEQALFTTEELCTGHAIVQCLDCDNSERLIWDSLSELASQVEQYGICKCGSLKVRRLRG